MASKAPGNKLHPRRTRLQAARHNPALRWIDPRFTLRWRIYIGQALAAGVLLYGVLLAQDVISSGAIVAAIAASVAIVFFVPHSVASSPVRIIGGHIAGVAAAYIVLGLSLFFPETVVDAVLFVDLMGAMALVFVIILMTVTNTEHAPAAGTALGLAVTDVPVESVLFILTSAVIVGLARYLLGSRLHNLI